MKDNIDYKELIDSFLNLNVNLNNFKSLYEINQEYISNFFTKIFTIFAEYKKDNTKNLDIPNFNQRLLELKIFDLKDLIYDKYINPYIDIFNLLIILEEFNIKYQYGTSEKIELNKDIKTLLNNKNILNLYDYLSISDLIELFTFYYYKYYRFYKFIISLEIFDNRIIDNKLTNLFINLFSTNNLNKQKYRDYIIYLYLTNYSLLQLFDENAVYNFEDKNITLLNFRYKNLIL